MTQPSPSPATNATHETSRRGIFGVQRLADALSPLGTRARSLEGEGEDTWEERFRRAYQCGSSSSELNAPMPTYTQPTIDHAKPSSWKV
jgi:hypothetical protein